jgi:hypothetical protein
VDVGANVRMAADSTMLRMVKRLIALSLGVHREQLEQRMGLTWPRPFLLRPLWFGQYDESRRTGWGESWGLILGRALLDHDGLALLGRLANRSGLDGRNGRNGRYVSTKNWKQEAGGELRLKELRGERRTSIWRNCQGADGDAGALQARPLDLI